MQNITINEGQNVLDVMIQHFGDLEQAFDFAIEQNISLTDYISPGNYITALVPDMGNQSIIETLNKPQWIPATNDEPAPGGIGIDGLSIDFEIG